MDTAWLVVLAAAVGGISGSLGAFVTTRSARLLSREERIDARRERVYLELLTALHRALGEASRIKTARVDSATLDPDPLLRGYSLSVFGSHAVRMLYFEAMNDFVAFRLPAQTHEEVAERYRECAASVFAVEEDVEKEMAKPPTTRRPWSRRNP
jgi:hypothetical protein